MVRRFPAADTGPRLKPVFGRDPEGVLLWLTRFPPALTLVFTRKPRTRVSLWFGDIPPALILVLTFKPVFGTRSRKRSRCGSPPSSSLDAGLHFQTAHEVSLWLGDIPPALILVLTFKPVFGTIPEEGLSGSAARPPDAGFTFKPRTKVCCG